MTQPRQNLASRRCFFVAQRVFSAAALSTGVALATLAGIVSEPASAELEHAPACNSDVECGDGLACVEGACGAPGSVNGCTNDSGCLPGYSCNPAGQCVDPGATLMPTPPTSNQGTGEEQAACVTGELNLTSEIPTVLILVDQSLSMSEDFGGDSRWNVLRDALTDPRTGVIKTLEDQVRFGLTLYSSERGYGRSGDRTCPMLEGLDTLSLELGNHQAIRDLYLAASPVRDTPTAESLALATDALLAHPVDGPKAILLATDGDPDTCEDPDAHDDAAKQFSEATVKAAFDAGISTYVLSVGDDVAQDHLQRLANAGVGGSADASASYWQATEQTGLKSALEAIVSGVRSCAFELEGNVDTSLVSAGTVKLDSEELVHGTDWTLNDAGQVELSADRCEAIKTGNHQVSAEFPCLIDGEPSLY